MSDDVAMKALVTANTVQSPTLKTLAKTKHELWKNYITAYIIKEYSAKGVYVTWPNPFTDINLPTYVMEIFTELGIHTTPSKLFLKMRPTHCKGEYADLHQLLNTLRHQTILTFTECLTRSLQNAPFCRIESILDATHIHVDLSEDLKRVGICFKQTKEGSVFWWG
jgi:hypothetical protein